MMDLQQPIHNLIDLALQEDIRSGDITTLACISKNAQAQAKVILKQAGIVAGLPFLEILFKRIHPDIKVHLEVKEGSFQKAGTLLGTIIGPMRAIITGERVALNLIQHASGVATITAAYVKKVTGWDCLIMDTRKTLPGLRFLEKYAVKIGGGHNHRFGLDDRLIIKTNHLAYLAQSKQTVAETVVSLKNLHPELPVEIEVEETERLLEALETDVDAIMLINMAPEEAKKCVEIIKKTSKKVYIESSGAITLDTVHAYAKTGVHGISIGDLTHSVEALDIRMRLTYQN
ncbi:MAG: carboxylating nicotinate-nucleotide diphosphorylase [Chlamydiales bacterium]|nr:carboxylating nicotinate-nucleotide diphosphorylase [Chlamydiales bacterium]